MKTLESILVSVHEPLRSALAASLIWIPLGLGVSAHSSAQTTAQEAAQGTELTAPIVVPQQVRYAGKMADRTGATVEAEFRIYAAQEGGEPLWTETQQVTVGQDGSYSVLLGSASHSGLPQNMFAGGAARWLGVSVERGEELERVPLSSVPYAMKSADAESLAGHAATDFVTQAQLASLAGQQTAVAAPDIQPEISGTVTGSGTANTVPLWTGALTQGNSDIVQVGSDIGIHEATPGATLDVGGTATIRGATTLEGATTLSPMNTATTTSGYASQLLDLSASAWSTTASGPVAQTFRMFSYPEANNTATPSGNLLLQFQEGTGSVANILSIASNGVIGFNSAQTFPGTIKSVAGTSPVTASTTSGAVTVGLNTSALETTLNGVYAQLGAANTFTKPITFAPSQTFPITGTGGGTITGITTSSPLTGSGTSGSVAIGLNSGALLPAITPPLETTFNGVYAQLGAANTFTTGQTISGMEYGNMLTVSNDASSGSWAIFATNYAEYGQAIYAAGGADGIGIKADAALTAGSEGILGDAPNGSGNSDTYYAIFDDFAVGMWADGANGSSGALIATTDDLPAAFFENDSLGYATLELNNTGGGATDVPHGIATVLRAEGKGGVCGINQTGNLACTGQMKAVVAAKDSPRQLETYTVQSAENWVEDYGSGELSNGSATVQVEPEFAETVNTGVDFHVFLTPGGDCKGLYVTNKTPGSFEVHELGGGTSSIPFDYKIVAKRNGMESQRLVDVTERMRTEAEAARPKPKAHPLPGTKDPRSRPSSTTARAASARAR